MQHTEAHPGRGYLEGRADRQVNPKNSENSKKGLHMYDTLINIIKTIATISSVLMFVVIAYFAQSLNVEEEKDKAAMVGFCWMMITIAINIVCMWM
jgi:hypothetical protein